MAIYNLCCLVMVGLECIQTESTSTVPRYQILLGLLLEVSTNFITGMGGYLQSVLFGYGGLRMHSDRVDFNCTPIPDTTGFTVRGKYKFYNRNGWLPTICVVWLWWA